MLRTPLLIAAALLVLAGCRKAPDPGIAPHQIHIVGASAAFPFSSIVAEQLMRADAEAIAPLVRAGGSGEGIARFCEGPGRTHPDIVIATRDMTPAEARRCAANGVPHVARVPIGFTAFVAVVATAGPALAPTRAAFYRALTSSTVRTWADAGPGLPALPIHVEGPAPDPAIADGLFDRILAPGCATAGTGPNCAAIRIRRDGAYAGHGADAELVARAVAEKPGTIGLLPYAQAIRHRDTLRILPLDGIEATPATIAAGRYPASAPLLLFAKPDEAAAVPSLTRLLGFYAAAMAPGGAFAAQGFVPLPDAARADAARRLASLGRP